MNKIELDIKFCNDIMLIESYLKNNLIKTASFSFESFGNSVKSYFENQIDPNDKTGSIFNALAPGAILFFFSKQFPIISLLLSGIASWMGIDFAGMFSSVFNKLKPAIMNGTADQSDVEDITNSVISSQDTEFTPEQQQKVEQGLKLAKNLSKEKSIYIESYFNLNAFNKFASKSPKTRVLGFIGTLIATIFKIALMALGLNVATNTAKKMMGQPNAFENKTYDKTENKSKAVSIVKSTQKVFPVKLSYSDRTYNVAGSNWIEKYNNSSSGISLMLVNFAKEVYDGLDGLESDITNNPSFKIVLDRIEDYNINASGEPIVFLPKEFNSKKQLVDHFIDDVAIRSNKQKPVSNKLPEVS